MRRFRIVSVACVAIAALMGGGTVALAQIPPGYELIQITDGSYYDFGPKINNHGQIVFTRWYNVNDRSTEEIFLYDPDQGGLIRLTNDNIQDVGPVINDDGVIAWSRGIGPTDPDTQEPGLEIMIRTPGGQITRITDNTFTDYSPEINAAGHLVWEAEVAYAGCADFGSDIFFYDGQTIESITSDGLAELIVNQSPAINDLDQIVWGKFDFCPDPWESEIWMWDQAVSTKLTTDQFEPTGPDINNVGLVAWTQRSLGSRAIDLWENGVTSTLTTWGAGPRLNDQGDITFYRWYNTEGTYQQWLYQEYVYWQLSNDDVWNIDGHINENTEVVWEYGGFPHLGIRYLRRFQTGDLNCDGSINGFDIEPFVVALTDPSEYTIRYVGCNPMLGDTDSDGSLNGFDIEPFVSLLTQGG